MGFQKKRIHFGGSFDVIDIVDFVHENRDFRQHDTIRDVRLDPFSERSGFADVKDFPRLIFHQIDTRSEWKLLNPFF
jgi:hypothetical protein